MNHELKQVDVRLKLVDKEGVFSMESIDTPAKAVSIMVPILAELDREEVCVVNLDGKNHPINFNIVSIGSLNASLVTGREVYKSAVLSNAARVIMLHNHPSSSLAPSREDREVTGKMMYAGSFLDIELQDHIIVAGRTGETFSMREHLPELFDRKNYMEPMAHVADLVREEAPGSEVSPVTYEILQIKDGSNGEAYRFMGTRYIRQQKLPVNASDYESKYRGELKPGETLDTLYERFNIHRPDDFTGHSLSVSDVIVLESEGKKTPFYVDSFGFQKLENFFEERFVRTEAEKKIISDFREKTQKYFRPVDGRKAEEMEIVEDKEEGGFVVSYPELPGCITCGETMESAIANAQDAKKAWVQAALEEGIEIHEPDSLEEYSGQFKLRIPRSLHRSLAEHSKREGISMNQYCVYLLSRNDAILSK